MASFPLAMLGDTALIAPQYFGKLNICFAL